MKRTVSSDRPKDGVPEVGADGKPTGRMVWTPRGEDGFLGYLQWLGINNSTAFSANSILLVTFAREQQLAGLRAFDAAISAGRTRIRPVKIWPNITVKRAPPSDSKEWEGKPDKLQYFSPNPGAGN